MRNTTSFLNHTLLCFFSAKGPLAWPHRFLVHFRFLPDWFPHQSASPSASFSTSVSSPQDKSFSNPRVCGGWMVISREGAPPDMSTSPLRLPFDASQGDGMWAEPWFPCRPSRTLTSTAESFYAHAIALLRALLVLGAWSGRVVRVPAGGAVNIKVREPNPKKCLSISSPCSLSICFQ